MDNLGFATLNSEIQGFCIFRVVLVDAGARDIVGEMASRNLAHWLVRVSLTMLS